MSNPYLTLPVKKLLAELREASDKGEDTQDVSYCLMAELDA